MLFGVDFVDTVFSPAEAERITGVSATLQRDWRRRGYLPSFEGHARFTTADLCQMWVLQLLAERGIGPAHSSEYARSLSARLSGWALSDRAAWSGDLVKAFGSDECPPVHEFLTLSTGRLRRFWIIANEAMATTDDLGAYFDEIAGTPKVLCAAIVLDLEALGAELRKRAGRALIHVQVDSAE